MRIVHVVVSDRLKPEPEVQIFEDYEAMREYIQEENRKNKGSFNYLHYQRFINKKGGGYE